MYIDEYYDPVCYSGTDLFIYILNIVPLFFAAIFGVGYLIFAPFEVGNFMNAGAILTSSLVIFGVLMLVKWPIKNIKNRITRCKTSMLIGLGGISICTIGGRVLIFFIEGKEHLPLYTYMVSTAASILLYFIFIREFDKECKFNRNPSKLIATGYCILSIIHFVMLIISLKIATLCEYSNPKDGLALVISWQLGSSIICASSSIEFYAVVSGGRKSRMLDAPRRLETVRVAPRRPETRRPQNAPDAVPKVRRASVIPQIAPDQLTVSYPIPECKICTLRYSTTTRTPRMLSNCGHTICQECVGRLITENWGNVVQCPYCQTATAVNGPVEKLPKNFALTEILENIES